MIRYENRGPRLVGVRTLLIFREARAGGDPQKNTKKKTCPSYMSTGFVPPQIAIFKKVFCWFYKSNKDMCVWGGGGGLEGRDAGSKACWGVEGENGGRMEGERREMDLYGLVGVEDVDGYYV